MVVLFTFAQFADHCLSVLAVHVFRFFLTVDLHYFSSVVLYVMYSLGVSKNVSSSSFVLGNSLLLASNVFLMWLLNAVA